MKLLANSIFCRKGKVLEERLKLKGLVIKTTHETFIILFIFHLFLLVGG